MRRVGRAGREHPLEAVALGLVLLFAAAVRIAYVGDPPVRYDEVFTWQQYATNSVRHIVTDYTYPNNHILNSLAAIASGLSLGAPLEGMAAGLGAFGGVERRFQRLGEAKGVSVIEPLR